MFGLQAAHNVTVTPIQAMSNEAQPDSIKIQTSVIKGVEDEKTQNGSGVKLKIRRAYRKARKRMTFHRRHSSASLGQDSVVLSSQSSESDEDSESPISSTYLAPF